MQRLPSLARLLIAACVLSCACFRTAPRAAEAEAPAGTPVLLLGTGNAGVFRSTDGGANWQAAGNGLPLGGVWQILGDPAHRGTAYLTTGTVFRSTDAGLHWQPVPGLFGNGPGITALATSRSAMLAAGAGVVLGGGPRIPWTARLPAIPGGAPRSLTVIAPRLAYAVGSDGLLYLFDGRSWNPMSSGLPAAPITAFTYVRETALPGNACPPLQCVVLYAGVAGHGLWQSLDSGHTWSTESAEHGALPAGSTIRALLSTDLRTTYAAVEGHGLYRSQHSGQFWQPARRGPGYTFTALISADNTIVGATDGHGAGIFDATTAAFVWRRGAAGLPAGAVGISLASVAVTAPPAARIAHLPGPCSMVAGFPLCEPFRRFYWAGHPPLLLFGNPISAAQFDPGDPRTIVQYFDRARFEYRPDLPGKVRLTPVGRLLTARRHFTPRHAVPGEVYFKQTGFGISGAILTFWRKHGGASILGYPVSPVLREQNGDGTNRQYTLQYFEYARVEIHPEQSNTPFSIELGLLGKQYMCARLGAYCRN